MRRPIRTRRLSITAIASCAAFTILLVTCIRSFRTGGGWSFAYAGRPIVVEGGRIIYTHCSWVGGKDIPSLQISGDTTLEDHHIARAIIGFSARNILYCGMIREFRLIVPLWPMVLLLLVVPGRWLIARPAIASAFPVIIRGERD